MSDVKDALIKKPWKKVWSFTQAAWNDHDLLIRAVAVKGGIGAIAAAITVGVSFAITLPFTWSALALAGCGLLIGLGIGGIALGAGFCWKRGRNLYREHIQGLPPIDESADPAAAAPHATLADQPAIKKWLDKPLMKKFLASRTWKKTKDLTRKQEEFFMASLAGGGSVIWGIASVAILVTQIAILPVVALGGILTVTTAVAIGSLLSAGYGVYLSAQKFIQRHRKAKEETEKKPPAAEKAALDIVIEEMLKKKRAGALKESFTQPVPLPETDGPKTPAANPDAAP